MDVSAIPLAWRIRIEEGRHPDCWLWTGDTYPNGYGRTPRPQRLAHRAVYETMVGPIPDGMTIDHLCVVRRCVNPAHMEVVTRGENTLRGNGPSAQKKRMVVCLRGHPFDGVSSAGKRVCRRCNRDRMRALRSARKG